MGGRNEHPASGYIDRIVALEEQKREIALAIREVYREVEEADFLKGSIRMVVKRKLETDGERASREAIESEAEQIMVSLGMLRDTPLGDAAMQAFEEHASELKAASDSAIQGAIRRGPGRPRKDAKGAAEALAKAREHFGEAPAAAIANEA